MFNELNIKIKQLSEESDNRKSLDLAIDAANEIIKILAPNADNLKAGEDALDEAIPTNQFPNNKVESWFSEHPYFTGDKVALRFYSSELVETRFYWLSDNATKARVSAGVMLAPNWEDSELTRNDSYKIGIDFFLSSNTKSLLVVVSNKSNLRLIEFSDHLSHTQIEILQKLHGSLNLSTKDQIHKTIWDALALREVNKKFYAGIAEQFNILLNHLSASGRDKEDSKLFASRLIGRLLFLWFLRRKNIIQEQYGYFDINGSDSTEYYDKKLKKLFFATLNKPIEERVGQDDKTPYLNGGLFEAHDNDWPLQLVDFPKGFFNGLYEHLEKYNFTTDESSPEYEQVAIDPEMLGRVFESLLATQLTETGEQARKAKGTFYTPREIVSYMCKESLRQYLYTKLDNGIWNDGIDKLLDASDSEWEINHSNSKRNLWGEANRNIVPLKVIGALNELKVLDPACGSGAFPMGMLQLILKTYDRLDTTYDPYKKKLQIIQNTIFGVDIEPMAVEISRLRAWLSLVVEDEDNNHIEPLPNLDFKFVCANSLLPLDKQTGFFADANLHEKLNEVRLKFFNAKKPDTKDKWRKEYYSLTGSGQTTFGGDRRDTQLKSFDPFKNSHNADFLDADYMFGVGEGFDIVIGNPPYVDYRKIDDHTKASLNDYAISKHSKMINLYTYFFELGLNNLKDNGVLIYISPQQYLIYGGCKGLRDLLRNFTVLSLSDFARANVFEVGTYPFVSLVQKKKTNIDVKYLEFDQISDMSQIKRTLLLKNPIEEPVNISPYLDILTKIEYDSMPLKNVVNDIFVASSSTQNKLQEYKVGLYKFIEASNVFEYYFSNITSYISTDIYSQQSLSNQLNNTIIYTSRMTNKIRAAKSQNNQLLGGKVNVIVPKNNNVDLILALLNSKLINFWYREKFSMQHMQGGALPINAEDLKNIPVPKSAGIGTSIFTKLVEEVILAREKDNYSEIMAIEAKIDEAVYKLYNLMVEDINVIEQVMLH